MVRLNARGVETFGMVTRNATVHEVPATARRRRKSQRLLLKLKLKEDRPPSKYNIILFRFVTKSAKQWHSGPAPSIVNADALRNIA